MAGKQLRVPVGAALLAAATALSSTSAAAASPVIPSWVKTGFEVQYAEDLGGYVDYDYTDSVTARTASEAKITTYRWSPGVPGTAKYLYWSCAAACQGLAASTSAQFWVDPSDPLASLKYAPFHYHYQGVVSFPFKGRTWKAELVYQPSAHGPIVSYFQASTGLLLYHKEYGYAYHVWYTIQISLTGVLH